MGPWVCLSQLLYCNALSVLIISAHYRQLWAVVKGLKTVGSFCRYFWLNAGILGVGLVVYYFVARNYQEKPIMTGEKVRRGLLLLGSTQQIPGVDTGPDDLLGSALRPVVPSFCQQVATQPFGAVRIASQRFSAQLP